MSGNVTKHNAEMLAALSGRNADRERMVGFRARRVVMASAGVMAQQRARRRRVRALTLAAAAAVLIIIAPLLWRLADLLVTGDQLGDQQSQIILLVLVLCLTLLAAVLVAGWRNRSKKP